MTTFCLIHGNWHDGSSWDRLLEPLAARGHRVIAPDLPIDDPRTDWNDRVEPALKSLDGVDDLVVVVAHSAASGYGALVAAQLEDPLLVHLCPRLSPFPDPPGAPEPFRPGFPFPPRAADGTTAWERDAAIGAMYTRLAPDDAEALADSLRPSSPPAGEFPLSGHPDVETALILARKDELFEPDWERFMAREFLGVEPIELPGGHFPMVEDPEGLASILHQVAGGRASQG